MRAVVQRVTRASVTVDGECVGRIDRGLVALLGVKEGDGEDDAAYIAEKIAGLRLPMMTPDNRSLRGTAFTVSVDARHGITTGISARERAHTIRTAVAPDTSAEDLVTRISALESLDILRQVCRSV